MVQAVSFTVTPEAIPDLCADLQDVELKIREFARIKNTHLRMRPLGSDPVSVEFARVHNANAAKAIKAVLQYADQLGDVITALQAQNRAYHVTEHETTATFSGHR